MSNKIMTINQPLRLTEALIMVEGEVVRARTKWPSITGSAHHHYAVLKEELDETWDEIKHDNLPKARAEMLQVAAMAIRFLMEAGEPQQQPVPQPKWEDLDHTETEWS